MTISTRQLVDLALELAEMSELPADSAVYLNGSGISRMMAGIDIGSAELLLARDLDCDAVLAHHPAGGTASLRFPEVLQKQIDFMIDYGVEPAAAREAAQPLITSATMRAHAANHDHTPSVARLLRMPFLNIHLPLDEIGRRIMVAAVDEHLIELNRAPTVQDAIDALMTLSEFRSAQTPIMVPVGAVDSPLGRLAVVHGAGTNGGERIARAYFEAGVGTVLYIHCAGPDVVSLQRDVPGNLIVAGHIASDLVGINHFIREVEARGVEIVRMSGL